MGMENRPFSFALSVVNPSLAKKRHCHEKAHRRWKFRAALVGRKKSLVVSRKTEKMALGWGAGSAETQSENLRPVKRQTKFFAKEILSVGVK
jgi:hypothetical protein